MKDSLAKTVSGAVRKYPYFSIQKQYFLPLNPNITEKREGSKVPVRMGKDNRAGKRSSEKRAMKLSKLAGKSQADWQQAMESGESTRI